MAVCELRIVNFMFLYNRYSKRKEYERVARQVVKKYPFLASPVDPYVSVQYLCFTCCWAIFMMYVILEFQCGCFPCRATLKRGYETASKDGIGLNH